MTLKSEQNAIDGWWNGKHQALIDAQAAYFATHGRYAQGLMTHSTSIDRTAGGPSNDKNPDRLTFKPTDQSEDWLQVVGPPFTSGKFKCAVRVDAYETASGQFGWVIVLQFDFNGETYQRSINHGPETFREQQWNQRLRVLSSSRLTAGGNIAVSERF